MGFFWPAMNANHAESIEPAKNGKIQTAAGLRAPSPHSWSSAGHALIEGDRDSDDIVFATQKCINDIFVKMFSRPAQNDFPSLGVTHFVFINPPRGKASYTSASAVIRPQSGISLPRKPNG